MEHVAGFLSRVGETISFDNLKTTMKDKLGGVDVPGSAQIDEVSVHLAVYAGATAGANIFSVSLVQFSMGFALTYNLLEDYWKISRGVELEQDGVLEVAAEEYIKWYNDSETV